MLTPSSKATGMHTNHLMTTKCGRRWYHSLLLRSLPIECQDLARPAFSANHMLKGKDSQGFILFLCTLTQECIHGLREAKTLCRHFQKPRLKPQPVFTSSPLLPTHCYCRHLISFLHTLCFLLSGLKPRFLNLSVKLGGSLCSWWFCDERDFQRLHCYSATHRV